jgi:hypothetical protein
MLEAALLGFTMGCVIALVYFIIDLRKRVYELENKKSRYTGNYNS